MKKFKKIFVETTNVCNLDCSFCPKTKRSPKMLTAKEFETIIQKIKGHTDYVYLHIMGEPLLNPDLEKFLEINYQNNIKTVITTNGTLIKKCQDILLNSKSLYMMSISLHSFEANENERKIQDYLNDIIKFSKKANDKKIIISLRLWNLDGKNTKGQNGLNDLILSELEKGFELDFKIKDEIKNKNRISLKNYIKFERAEKFVWPDSENEEKNQTGFCYGLRNHIGILSDGTIVPCCLDHEGDLKLGNIFEDSLDTALNCDRAKRIYEGFNNRKPIESLCKGCGFIEKFN